MAEMEKELKSIRKELVTIRRYLEDGLDNAERTALRDYHAEKTKGTLTSHERLKKELL